MDQVEFLHKKKLRWLFTHGSVDANAAGAYQQDGNESGEVGCSGFMAGQWLSFQGYEGGYPEIDDQRQGCEPGEQPQHHEDGTEYFCKDAKYQGNAVTDMEQVKEAVFEIAEMGDLAQAVNDQEQKPEGKAQGQGGDVEGAFRVGR